jgi:cobalt-zinc-cadmium efflux system protein
MLTDERPLMTLHATLRPGADNHAALLAIRGFLEQHYGVGHATIQIEPRGCPEGGPEGDPESDPGGEARAVTDAGEPAA